jgi:antitoxin (DNA-binding transcriptional repressor) of toxin-antitoxin stability system
MKSVGIKNLKNNLSRYLNLVREGEIVFVTDRDEIIAEIHKPIRAPLSSISEWDAFLNELEREGSILRARQKVSTIREAVGKVKHKLPTRGPTLQEILDETRADAYE